MKEWSAPQLAADLPCEKSRQGEKDRADEDVHEGEAGRKNEEKQLAEPEGDPGEEGEGGAAYVGFVGGMGGGGEEGGVDGDHASDDEEEEGEEVEGVCEWHCGSLG